jgi:hypothetical protein
MFYRIYAEIVTRLSVDRNQRDLPHIPCQVCALLEIVLVFFPGIILIFVDFLIFQFFQLFFV